MPVQARKFLGLAVLTVILTSLLWVPVVEKLEVRTYDLRFPVRGMVRPEAKVVIVNIDNATLDAWHEPKVAWGSHFANLMESVTKAGGKVIGLDLVIATDTDGYLAEVTRHALARAGKTPAQIAQWEADTSTDPLLHPNDTFLQFIESSVAESPNHVVLSDVGPGSLNDAIASSGVRIGTVAPPQQPDQLRPGTTVLVEEKRLLAGKAEPMVLSRLSPAAMTPTPQTRRILGQWLRGEKGLDDPEPSIGAVAGPEVALKWANNIPLDKRTGLILELKRKGDEESFLTQPLDAEASTFTVNITDDSLYRWKVHSQDDKYEVSGVFRLLTPEEKTAVETLEKSAKAMHKSNPNDPAADLLLARGYENAWLFQKALECYRAAQLHSHDKEEITQLTEVLSKKY